MKKFLFAAMGLATLASISSANLVADPGFEGIGNSIGGGSSFPAYPNFNNGWAASQTDGEVMLSVIGRPSHSGEYYADLLQNAGGNPDSFWDEANFGFGNYDRIVTLVNVSPNTAYDISFWHAGGDRFGYTADTTLLQVQSMNTAQALSQRFATPGLFQWTQATTTFTTDGSTTQLAIQFSSIGAGNSSALIDDVDVSVVPEPATLAALGLGVLALRRRNRR